MPLDVGSPFLCSAGSRETSTRPESAPTRVLCLWQQPGGSAEPEPYRGSNRIHPCGARSSGCRPIPPDRSSSTVVETPSLLCPREDQGSVAHPPADVTARSPAASAWLDLPLFSKPPTPPA